MLFIYTTYLIIVLSLRRPFRGEIRDNYNSVGRGNFGRMKIVIFYKLTFRNYNALRFPTLTSKSYIKSYFAAT